MVVVKKWFDDQITTLQNIEMKARDKVEENISDRWAIATAKEPAKEAKEIWQADRNKENKREPHVPLQKPPKKLPTTRKAAIDELSFYRDVLEPSPIENAPTPSRREDLQELQLMAESLMWASTYDFSWKSNETSKLEAFNLEPAPLPPGLWKELVKRYIDPDKGQSYKDVGPLERLGTVKAPWFDMNEFTPKEVKVVEKPFTPEVRLSHYFSNVLYPEIFKENGKIVDKLRRLGRLNGELPPSLS
jgi:hypothetical protein